MILSGIIIVLLVYLIFGTRKNKMSYKIPSLTKIAPGEVTKIEISKAGRQITLLGEDDAWKIMPEAYSADPEKVKDMLKVIDDLKLTELAAEKKDYQRYDLSGDKKINVKAYKDDELVREFDIGKIPSTYRHTFVRIGGDERVYYAQDSFRSHFDNEAKDLRDKVVMTFDKNEVTEIILEPEKQTIVLTKKMAPAENKPEENKEEKKAEPSKPKEEEAWVSAEGKVAEKSKVDVLIESLSDLKCDDYIEGKTKEDFKTPVYHIMLKGAKDYSLDIFSKEEKDNGKYPALSSENPYPFLLSTYKAEQIMKKPDDLFKGNENK